ncbi:MAG TPA: NADPH-dependent FMN reductase [Parvibaculum sp.]
MRLLAISGSLRSGSSNTRLLEAARAVAPEGVDIVLYEGIGALPHFNPDMEDAPIEAVTAFRAALAASDGVIFSTPEYAHGLPGVLKNALDWVVGSSELAEKPVALFNASPRSTHAVASLTEILTVMSARVCGEAGLTVQLAGRALPEGGIAADADLARLLRAAIAAFARSIEAGSD